MLSPSRRALDVEQLLIEGRLRGLLVGVHGDQAPKLAAQPVLELGVGPLHAEGHGVGQGVLPRLVKRLGSGPIHLEVPALQLIAESALDLPVDHDGVLL